MENGGRTTSYPNKMWNVLMLFVLMQEEYGSLMANGMWELVPLPKYRKSVGCKWVFCTKRDASGHIVRHKARLVAKGYSQVEGVDFNETFAPVAKFTTIRCMLAIGAAMDLEIHQMDVKTILEWGIGGHLHGPTARIRARWQGAPRV